MVFAPLVTGGKAFGRISLQNIDRTDAFTDADVRLLTTLASSLSVALENARLFDETQRLLTETNERAAELAIINSVQQGLAENLDMQSMYDLVGDKITRDLRCPGGLTSAISTSTHELVHFPYTVERGERLEIRRASSRSAPLTRRRYRRRATHSSSTTSTRGSRSVAKPEVPFAGERHQVDGLCAAVTAASRSRRISTLRTSTRPVPSARPTSGC